MRWGLCRRRFFRSFSIGLFALGAAAAGSYGASVNISIRDQDAPADDLVYQGTKIDRDQAIDLIQSGVDISSLDPSPTDFWDPNAKAPETHYPPIGVTVSYESTLSTSKNIMRTRVYWVSEDGSRASYQLSFSLKNHAALARNSLLRRLGYPIPAPKYYSSLTIHFVDAAQKDAFMSSLSDSTLTAKSRWIAKGPNSDTEVTLQDALLEPAQLTLPTYHWGELPASHIKGKRALRALIVPLVLLDINESVNLYSFEMGKILNEAVMLNYSSAAGFQTTSYEDAKWIARKIGSLSRKDLEEIVAEGQFPLDVARIVTEKLVARRNNLVQLFNVVGSLPVEQQVLPFNQFISGGDLHNGKLTRTNYEGYASRFSYGDPDSPLRPSELRKYLFMSTITLGLNSLTSTLSKYLQVHTSTDVITDFQRNTVQNAMKWIASHPGMPYTSSVDLFAGPIGGFGVQASRMVMAGNLFSGGGGANLIDAVGVTASVGVFAGVGGLKKTLPNLTANVAVQRSYIHVRPVPDMTSAMKYDWTHLMVPYFLMHIGSFLEDPNPEARHPPSEEDRYNKFLDALKENEIIMITDSTTLGAKGQMSVPIPVLMDPTVAIFNPSVGATIASYPTVLRRTMITRTKDGIQVYVQSSKVLNAEFQFDFNWWINVARFYHENRESWTDTQAYLLDKGSATKDVGKLILSMRALLRSNDTEVLEENFKEYKIHHDLSLDVEKGKFLWWAGYRLDEDHRVKVTPPEHPELSRTLVSRRSVFNLGVNAYAFISDIISAASKGMVALPGTLGWSASYSPFGWAHWSSVTTEAEVTPVSVDSNGEPINENTTKMNRNPVSLVETHYSGWFLSKKALFEIIDLLEEKAKILNFGRPLVRKEDFTSTKHLELYDIASNLIIYSGGVDRMIGDLFKPLTSESLTALIDIEGKEELKRWCLNGDRKTQNTVLGSYTFSFQERGRTINYSCVKPWMQKLMSIRSTVLEARKTGPESAEDRVKWQNSLVKLAAHNIDLPKFLNWLGKDNYFFQIRVNGFRSNDENGDTDYVSDSIGNFNPKEGTGPFRDFAMGVGIMGYELYGRYMAEGYMGQ